MATLVTGTRGKRRSHCLVLCNWPVGLMAKSRVDYSGVAWELAPGTELQGPTARDPIGFASQMKQSPRLPEQRLVFSLKISRTGRWRNAEQINDGISMRNLATSNCMRNSLPPGRAVRHRAGLSEAESPEQLRRDHRSTTRFGWPFTDKEPN